MAKTTLIHLSQRAPLPWARQLVDDAAAASDPTSGHAAPGPAGGRRRAAAFDFASRGHSDSRQPPPHESARCALLRVALSQGFTEDVGRWRERWQVPKRLGESGDRRRKRLIKQCQHEWTRMLLALQGLEQEHPFHYIAPSQYLVCGSELGTVNLYELELDEIRIRHRLPRDLSAWLDSYAFTGRPSPADHAPSVSDSTTHVADWTVCWDEFGHSGAAFAVTHSGE